jgi:hypothetical protein
MYPRVKYQLADGHADGDADGVGTPAMHASEANRLLVLIAPNGADAAAPDVKAATAAPADPS